MKCAENLGCIYICIQAFPGGSDGRACLLTEERPVQPLGREDPLESEMATHSSILAWEIPWTEEPGGLQSMKLQKQSELT